MKARQATFNDIEGRGIEGRGIEGRGGRDHMAAQRPGKIIVSSLGHLNKNDSH